MTRKNITAREVICHQQTCSHRPHHHLSLKKQLALEKGRVEILFPLITWLFARLIEASPEKKEEALAQLHSVESHFDNPIHKHES